MKLKFIEIKRQNPTMLINLHIFNLVSLYLNEQSNDNQELDFSLIVLLDGV